MLIINIPHDSNTTSWVGTQEVSWLDTSHYRNKVSYLRKVIDQYMQKEQKNVVSLRSNLNWDSIDCFSETKWNPEVISKFGKCLSLFGIRTK